MGFSDDFKKIGTTLKQYNRVGNSIVVPMVIEIGKEVNNQLFNKSFELNY